MSLKQYYILMGIVFLLSRIVVSFYGVEFDTIPLEKFWQYIDISLMRDKLLESLYYLHTQPPLFNLFLGIGVKLFPQDYPIFFHTIYMLMSFGLYLMIFNILISYGISKRLAFVLATIYIVMPEAILYENWLFYTWYMAFFILLSVYMLLLYSREKRLRYAVGFLVSLTIMALSRSSFHLIIVIASIAILLSIPSPYRKRLLLYSLIPIIIIISLFIKNYILFNTFSTSSWMGMNLYKIAKYSTDKSNIQNMYKRGEISELALIGSFKLLDSYPSKYREIPQKFKDIELLSSVKKKTDRNNFHYYGYINISKTLQKDSITIIKLHPIGYIKEVAKAWGIYTLPSWQYYFLRDNYKRIKKYVDILSLLKLRKYIEKDIFKSNYKYLYSSLLLIPLMLSISLLYLVIELKSGRVDRVQLYMLFIILILAIIQNSFEVGENNRFRVMTDPTLYTLFILSIKGLIERFKKSKSLSSNHSSIGST